MRLTSPLRDRITALQTELDAFGGRRESLQKEAEFHGITLNAERPVKPLSKAQQAGKEEKS